MNDGTYVMYSIISLLNIVDLIMETISSSSSDSNMLDISSMITAMSGILISRFLVCIREAAERSIQPFSSQSLSFVDSQGNAGPHRWLSSIEFAADIANPSAGDGDVDACSDLEDDLHRRGEGDAGVASNDGIELGEYATSGLSVVARTS